MSFFEIRNQYILVFIKARPGSQQNEIGQIRNNELIVRLKAQPEKGKANNELVKFLAKTLGIRKQAIDISKGETSRHKTLRLPMESLDKIKNLGA